ncbi:MAG: hypothetical protein LQ346_003583 [Caloplaca aetnensis]|nr:MAG: hypothetical protein LQ346_003583 [Caloplaca aetnensis]
MTKAFCPRCGAEFTRKTARNTHFADGLCKRLLPAPKAEGLQQTNAAKRKLEEEEQDYAKLDHKRRKGNPSQSGPHEFDEDDVLLKPQGREAPPSDGNLASIPEGFPRLDLFRHLDLQEEQELLLKLREEGLSFPEISLRYKKDFGKLVTVRALKERFTKLEELKPKKTVFTSNQTKERQFLWKLTQEEGLALTELSDRFEKELGRSLTRESVVKRLKVVWNERSLDLEKVLEVRRSCRE